MTDFENKDLTGQPAAEEPTASEPVAHETAAPVPEPTPEPQPEPTPQAPFHTAPATPHLTLEPDPVPPEIPVEEPHIAGSAAEPFHMPDPPHAPEPPQPEPAYQQTPPNYSQPQYENPQYTGPQYQQPPYGNSQPYYNKPLYNVPPMGYNQKSRLAAGLLAITFGVFGVHNYYLGFHSRATIQLVVTLVGMLLTFIVIGAFAVLGMYIWAFVEGVMLLSANPSRMYDGNGVITRD